MGTRAQAECLLLTHPGKRWISVASARTHLLWIAKFLVEAGIEPGSPGSGPSTLPSTPSLQLALSLLILRVVCTQVYRAKERIDQEIMESISKQNESKSAESWQPFTKKPTNNPLTRIAYIHNMRGSPVRWEYLGLFAIRKIALWPFYSKCLWHCRLWIILVTCEVMAEWWEINTCVK